LIGKKLLKKSVTFISLSMPYSTDLAVNKLIATNLVAIAIFENERRKEDQKQGISAAKAGRYKGRKTVITKRLIPKVKYLKQTKMLSISQMEKNYFQLDDKVLVLLNLKRKNYYMLCQQI
jgi:DNA invertase Pin-like site-specific DNA recombinase